MGFSVSGSAAIIFVGMFLAFGMFYTASANGFERVTEAQADQHDRTLTTQNTVINVTSATWDTSSGTLNVSVENTGATELSVADADLLANNTYLTGYDTDVDGDPATDLWLPQEVLRFSVTSLEADPDRVKVVTGVGVAATATTTEVS